MSITDWNEMVVVAVHAKNAGFKQVSVDLDDILEIAVIAESMVEFIQKIATMKPTDNLDLKAMAVEVLEGVE